MKNATKNLLIEKMEIDLYRALKKNNEEKKEEKKEKKKTTNDKPNTQIGT